MPTPIKRQRIVKKKLTPFLRQQADRHKRISNTWRSPKGIDSRMRRRFKGTRPNVKIGYGSNKTTKHLRPNHFYTFVVQNVSDLEVLLMHNRSHAAEIGHAVSYRTRKQIIERAAQLDVKVTNPNARVRHEE